MPQLPVPRPQQTAPEETLPLGLDDRINALKGQPQKTAPEKTLPPSTPPMTQAEAFAEVVRRANAGNEQCLAGLRAQLDNNPEIWRKAGDVGVLAEKAWIELISTGNKLAEESILRRQRELKADLAGPQPTALEKLLIDLVGVTFLATCQAEHTAASPPGGSIQLATYRLKRAESAQRRFARAVRTLTLVRALLPREKVLPALEGQTSGEEGIRP